MAHILLGEVGGPRSSRGGKGAHILPGEVMGRRTSRGGRGPTYFSGR